MKNSLKLLLVITVVAALFSSCKKSPSDTSILEGHKWVLSTAAETYSDSAGISHNLLAGDTGCQPTSYMEFENNATNSVVKLYYTYITDNCTGQYSTPNVDIHSWNIDPNNTVLYLEGQQDGSGQTPFNIQTLTSSSMVLTTANTVEIAFNPTRLYHTVTDTWTYTVQ
jgi:hypothetical protein